MTMQVTDQLAALQLEKTKPETKDTISIGGWDIPVDSLNTWLTLSIMRNEQPFRTLPMAYFPCRSVHHFPPCFEYGVALNNADEIREFAACLGILDDLANPDLILRCRTAFTKRCQSLENWPPRFKVIRIGVIERRRGYYVLYPITNYSPPRDVITVSKLLPPVVHEMGWQNGVAWHFSGDNKGKILERKDWTIKLDAAPRKPCICWKCVS